VAIELIEDLKTVRTYPRIMRHIDSNRVAMVLHDHVSGIVWLSGLYAGKVVIGSNVDWESFEDHPGSVTLWNRD
jgi:hypothetical protein